MRLILLTVFTIGVFSQPFESDDFNVTGALISHGVNISALPQLNTTITERSNVACSDAVNAFHLRPGSLWPDFQISVLR